MIRPVMELAGDPGAIVCSLQSLSSLTNLLGHVQRSSGIEYVSISRPLNKVSRHVWIDFGDRGFRISERGEGPCLSMLGLHDVNRSFRYAIRAA